MKPSHGLDCRICGSPTSLFAKGTVLETRDAYYDRCVNCGFMQVRNVTWLVEAYAEAIADIDIGTIDRMVDCSSVTKTVLQFLFDPKGRFMDYGAGYGAFVRRMRDLGFQFHWYDVHCANLFAKGFAATLDGRYEAITAFEVLEHIEDPYAELETIMQRTSTLLFTTELLTPEPPPLDAWPYYAPETGQHISFYTERSLALLADRLGLHFVTNGRNFHLMSKRKVSAAVFRLLTKSQVSRVVNMLFSRGTLLYGDYQAGVRAARSAKARKV